MDTEKVPFPYPAPSPPVPRLLDLMQESAERFRLTIAHLTQILPASSKAHSQTGVDSTFTVTFPTPD